MLVEQEDVWDTSFATYVIRDGIPRITRNILPKRVKIKTAAAQNIAQNLKIKNEGHQSGLKTRFKPYHLTLGHMRRNYLFYLSHRDFSPCKIFHLILLSLEIFKIHHLIILGCYIFQYIYSTEIEFN